MLDPFSPSQKLTSISTGITAEDKTEKFLTSVQKTGDQLCEEFVKRRLIKAEASEYAEVSFFDPLPKQKLQTFSAQTILSIRLKGLEETLSSRQTAHFSASWSLLQGHENLTYLKPFPMS